MNISHLLHHNDAYLSVSQFKDYCINGLQVEGTKTIHKIATAVSVNQATIVAATEAQCQALLVHHGLFWGEKLFALTGHTKERAQLLLEHQINLLAYHLPLDMHPVIGNNVQLLQRLGATVGSPWEYGYTGTIIPQSHESLQRYLETIFQENTFKLIQNHDHPIENVLVITGGGASYLEKIPSDLPVDLFISGEIKENVYDIAKERNISYLTLGHYQSEQFGILALGQHLSQEFGIEHAHIDIWNPY